MSKCYRNEFYEWIKDKKIFNDMSTLNKETAIEIATCWLNGNDCYRILARNQGKNFSKICAIEFVWFIKDQRIAELEKENDELKMENNEFCVYNKKLREEKQTAVKEFADEVLRTMIEAKNEYRTFLERQRGFYQNFLRGRDWISSNKIYAKIDKLLKERGIE